MSIYEISEVRRWIDDLLEELGFDPFALRVNHNAWGFPSEVGPLGVILLHGEGPTEEWTISVAFPVMRVPLSNALPFYRNLLAKNWDLGGNFGTFGLDEENIVRLVARRSLEDADPSEVRLLLAGARYLLHEELPKLLQEFGAEWAIDD